MGIVMLFSEIPVWGIGILLATLISFPLENQLMIQINKKRREKFDDYLDEYTERLEKFKKSQSNLDITKKFKMHKPQLTYSSKNLDPPQLENLLIL